MRGITRLPEAATNGHLLVRPAGQEFFRRATCAEVECPGYTHGFSLRIDEGTKLGQQQAAYLRSDRSRRAQEHRDELGLTVFSYAPGNPCTEDGGTHKVPIERDPLFVLRRGTARRQVGASEWTDTLHEATDRITELRARG